MEAQFWHDRWQESCIAFHRESVNPRLERWFTALGVAAGEQVFVPLCGKSLDMTWLRSRGLRVLGVELSPIAVRAFLDEQAIAVRERESGSFRAYEAEGLRVLQGDVFDLDSDDLHGTRAVYDRAALIALPRAMRVDYVRHLSTHLPASVRWLLITLEYPQHEMAGPPFSVPQAEIIELFGGDFAIERLEHVDARHDAPQLMAKGLSELSESVFLLSR